MKKLCLLGVLLVAASTGLTADDNVCPCVPVSYVWTATTCETWNCAQAAMVLANGDPYVLSIATADTKNKWLVARRVAAGSAVISPDAPYVIDSFVSFPDAAARYTTLDPDTFPMITTASDGTMLVVRLREPDRARRRATRH